LAYLEELGITGIWLAGYSLSNPHHFNNIWTQYAVIEPDKFDPTLGTAEDFKELIDEAHRRGIKVFLDVITQGWGKNELPGCRAVVDTDGHRAPKAREQCI
jgi:glycosidase